MKASCTSSPLQVDIVGTAQQAKEATVGTDMAASPSQRSKGPLEAFFVIKKPKIKIMPCWRISTRKALLRERATSAAKLMF